MTRFDEVAQLRELGKRLVALKKRRRDWNSVNYGIMEEISIEQSLHNATPWLLDAAACFQPGDAEILRLMRNYLATHKPDGHLIENGPSTARGVDCMARLLKAAEIMEG